eukprot:2604930-Pleurochrysis_carterae.AAC.3
MQITGKKKTAWSGVYYNEEGKENDIAGREVVLPDGKKVPQLLGAETYKYLGTQLRPGRASGRHKEELLGAQEEKKDNERANKVLGVLEKRRTAGCWGGEEYLTKWDNGEQRWVNKLEIEKMNRPDAEKIYRAQDHVRESVTTFAERRYTEHRTT